MSTALDAVLKEIDALKKETEVWLNKSNKVNTKINEGCSLVLHLSC
jgi:uncharacterized protein YoxC